ncbi:hypothetical protein vseg_015236 [Gypsophila vaccaria]
MHGGEVPKRLVGYGFGVKQADVFGVHGMLRKEGLSGGVNNNLSIKNIEKAVANLTEENKGLVRQNEELQNKYIENNYLLKKMTAQFSQIIEVLSTEKARIELLDLTKTVLNSANSEVLFSRTSICMLLDIA